MNSLMNIIEQYNLWQFSLLCHSLIFVHYESIDPPRFVLDEDLNA